ncbi:HU family DNA-binding protein [Catenovulum agarivorans DS-2]|uniref:HU family DNA-binding protein n=1 Tax=Catenovulum agarivorans DS-2 TaxID=1328313 RepID=W7QLL4_9ALTE|nr:HU family DNA-binding protein [Catenovulum agarivorans]EWH09832.1 HU family DNA-binding protein [Catenovulum agarivorans DS-2]
MNKSQLITAIAEGADISKASATRALNSIIETVQTELASGGKVELIGFGTFSVSERAERQGRNPSTGAAITIPAARLPKFKPGKNLKDAVNS